MFFIISLLLSAVVPSRRLYNEKRFSDDAARGAARREENAADRLELETA